MSDIEAAIIDHEVRCEENIAKRLVPWPWMVGFIMLFILGISGVSWFLSAGYAETKSTGDYNTERCIKIEKRLDKLEDIQVDITWIRNDIENKNKIINERRSEWIKK